MFYSTNLLDPRWSLVLSHERIKLESDKFCDNIEDTPSFSKGVLALEMEGESENYLLFSSDNYDGEYVALDDCEKKKREKLISIYTIGYL